MPHSRPVASLLLTIAHGLLIAFRTFVHHLAKHAGVGIICAVAYFDPGNWSVDLQAGSSFGYRPMLFVVLMAGLGAIVLQSLATRLGCVTGLDLASHCRLLLYNRTRRPRLVRYLVLYPLYVLSELAIISTDLAELLGSAIGFCLIFPKLPLWAGVLITAADVLVFLAISDPYRGHGRPVRTFEFVIIGLVFAVFVCFVALLVKAKPNWDNVFMGYIPDKTLVKSQPDAVYTAVGILGATVMPHALFLGSSLATQNRVSTAPIQVNAGGTSVQGGLITDSQHRDNRTKHEERENNSLTFIRQHLTHGVTDVVSSLLLIAVPINSATDSQHRDNRTKHEERENNSLTFIRQHLTHGVTDVVSSLLLIAVPINSAILIIAASVFYTGPNPKYAQTVGLFDAHELIRTRIGPAAAFVFALALVCAGQVSSVTVTLAGQLVSEGFIEWQISPFLRRLITRLISLVPSVTVAVAVGRDGINTLLVASQVILSIVLPFVAFPLIYLTSSEKVMRVREHDQRDHPGIISSTSTSSRPSPDPNNLTAIPDTPSTSVTTRGRSPDEKPQQQKIPTPAIKSANDIEFLDFSNGKLVIALAYAIWCVVLVANAYAIVMLVIQWVN
ncbi:Manganese transporter SMF1 [Leucoagaricus sp. SymC.cos]|nr:Manganese transporter SMF1 [Leucoagaricus sp. SymC.cos]